MVSTRKGVNQPTKEESVFKQSRRESKKHGSFKLASAHRALQQPVSTVGQAPEVQIRQRDDRAVVRVSGGERDRVKSYVSEAWTGEALNRTRRQQ